MMNRVALFALLSLTGCGRTDLIEPMPVAPSPPAPPSPFDAGAITEYASLVFKGSECPTVGEERDLIPEAGERLAVVRFRAIEECSGVGGDWFIGHEVGTTNDIFVGQHGCWFFNDELRQNQTQVRYGLARSAQTAVLISPPEDWCLDWQDAGEPLTSDRRTITWGFYSSEAAAIAAKARLTAR